jgi:hypothetical protein
MTQDEDPPADDLSDDDLDDLAAFLMHRTADADLPEPERLEIFAVVGAYQEGYDRRQTQAALRTAGAAFGDHPDYRPAWRPTT